MTNSTLDQSVAEFLVGFSWKDIRAESLVTVKMLLKDQLACQIGACQLDWSRNTRRFMRKPRPGASTVVAECIQMDAADAAYLNATYGHGFEYDDISGNGHPGCCVVPVAIAVGEEVGASLGQVVEAMVAGYEVYARIGHIAAPDLVQRGWHPHAILANFGAAAVAAKLYGLDVKKSQHALAIALSHASGTTEYTATGGTIKRVHAGIGARNGIEAAALARAGITGPESYLTGDKGFFRTFVRRLPVPEAHAMFISEHSLLINKTWFKAYCCCGAHHAYIDAMAKVRNRSADIVAVDANVQNMTANLAGSSEVLINGPRSIEELQFSLLLQMALSALGVGNGYATHRAFLDGSLQLTENSEVIRFARRIKLYHSPELDRRYPRNFVADVTVHYQDGTSENILLNNAKGMTSNPLTPEEHQLKLTELTYKVVGERQANKLFELIDLLEPHMPVIELSSMLRLG